MNKTVLVPIADGTEELEAVTLIDTLRRGGGTVTVASVSGLQVTASRKVKLVADCLIADCAGKTYDCIALPGGMPGAEYLRDNAVLTELLIQQHKAKHLIAAICAAPAVILAHHGLLKGHKATCYPSSKDALPDKSVADKKVVVDDHFITSQGPGTALLFALMIVERLFGIERRKQVAEAMLA